MSAGGARRGRRDNGLDAADYAVAGDVDPRVGEHLLDVLAAGGIAAYLQPSADLNPILRTTTLPARPTDRLYVDRTHLDTAREHLDKLTDGDRADPTAAAAGQRGRPTSPTSTPNGPGSSPASTPPSTRPPRPGPPPRASTRARRRRAAGRAGATSRLSRGLLRHLAEPAPHRPADEPSLLDGLDTFGADAGRRRDERYTPPPPRRCRGLEVRGRRRPGHRPRLRAVPVPELLPLGGDLVTLLGFGAIVAGAVTLVWRLRSGDDDDDFDDGAVV